MSKTSSSKTEKTYQSTNQQLDPNKKKTAVGLKKARSHIDRIITMIENDEPCYDILQQIKAVIGILKGAHENTMYCHLQDCFDQGINSKDPQKKQEVIDKITRVTNLFNK
jgi:hypothetical protein NreA